MKNFKLLLATTAILSTGLAVVAMADGEYVGDPTGSVTLKASANFTTPIHASVESLFFGELDPVKGGTVVVGADGSFSGDAIITASSSSYNPFPGTIYLWGGMISDWVDDGEDLTTLVQLAIDPTETTITLHEDGDESKDVCGVVDNITTGQHKKVTKGNETNALEIKFGGTLTIDSTYRPESGYYSNCSGKKTITYVLNPQL